MRAAPSRSTAPLPASGHAMRRPIYRLMKRIATRALIELTPETGRRNQIRVHLADAECTIIGDRTYAARTNPARRLGLQQWQATHRTVVTERLTHVFWGNGDFDLAVDRAHTKYGVRTEVYGVESLTAKSLINAASIFHPIQEDLLL